MGHGITMLSFKESTPKENITTEVQRYVCNKEHSRLEYPIRWLDPICSDYEEADSYIREHDNGWYDNLAVRYREPAANATTEKLKTLEAKRHELTGKIRAIEDDIPAKKFKAQLVTCKQCGSKINKDYLKSNFCPLCRTDMRSQTVQDNLKRLRARREEVDKQIRAERSKLAESGTIHWLVKFEYHI